MLILNAASVGIGTGRPKADAARRGASECDHALAWQSNSLWSIEPAWKLRSLVVDWACWRRTAACKINIKNDGGLSSHWRILNKVPNGPRTLKQSIARSLSVVAPLSKQLNPRAIKDVSSSGIAGIKLWYEWAESLLATCRRSVPMARNLFFALAFVLACESAGANTPVTFSLNEPVSIAGVPPVTLGPGSYVVRTVDSTAGMNVVQVLSKRQDYVYTTVVTIPATRTNVDDKRQFVFSEAPSGMPPALHFWFPPGESSGHEFISPSGLFTSQLSSTPQSLQARPDRRPNSGQYTENAADLYGLRNVLQQIESGKFGAARDSFRRNYFLSQNREGAMVSFLLALLMSDGKEARASLELVKRLDPVRASVMSDLDVDGVVQSLPKARKDLQGSLVRRFLLNFALERIDDTVPRTAVLAFERHTLHGDSYPVELALNRRRDEVARRRNRKQEWVLARAQLAKLNDCVKLLLNRVGALEYSATVQTKAGLSGSVTIRVVLDRQKLKDLDAIVDHSQRTICGRHSRLEHLISERDRAVARELDSLRYALRELDKQPGSTTRSRFASIRTWETARPSDVSRDLMLLSEAANSPLMRPSSVFRADSGYVQMNIAGSLARLAESVGFNR